MFNIFDYFIGDNSWFGSSATHIDIPPVELFKQYFSENTYDAKARPPDELLKLDIEILSLADSWNLGQEKDIEYISKFVSNFCTDSKNYNFLSKDGKARIDSIFLEDSPSVRKAVTKSGCTKS